MPLLLQFDDATCEVDDSTIEAIGRRIGFYAVASLDHVQAQLAKGAVVDLPIDEVVTGGPAPCGANELVGSRGQDHVEQAVVGA